MRLRVNFNSPFAVLSISPVNRVADFHAALSIPTQDSVLLSGPRRMYLTLDVTNLSAESLPTALDLPHRFTTLRPLSSVPLTITLDTFE